MLSNWSAFTKDSILTSICQLNDDDIKDIYLKEESEIIEMEKEIQIFYDKTN